MTYAPQILDTLRGEAAEVIARYPSPRSALLPLLHLCQSVDGYVSPDAIAFCAETLGLTGAEVSAVATFYTQFKRQPNGRYTLGVCVTSLCAIMGGDSIFDRLSEYLAVGHDQTTADGLFTLERIECNAACDYAPVMMVNWEFFDNQSPASAVRLVDDLRAGRPVRPTRGPDTLATFQDVARVLAGFEDGRAGEGPAAGAPSRAGLELAAANGWSAPPIRVGQAATPDAVASSPAPPSAPAPSAKAPPAELGGAAAAEAGRTGSDTGQQEGKVAK
ncbi:MAG: NADH-quinone oxidoreductase subunit NuoE [Bifidobacteriaceae bacterium]|jgi:NADH-quinone oxidoreductase subunit E|nr:NADH-quinone oxidoreductase subunit NuoE [Bifidobacteriaceae bacterium]